MDHWEGALASGQVGTMSEQQVGGRGRGANQTDWMLNVMMCGLSHSQAHAPLAYVLSAPHMLMVYTWVALVMSTNRNK